MAKIIGPGSLNVDVTGYAPHLPVAGETTLGTTVRFSPGGKGNNQMTAVHRAGGTAKIIGARGNDFLGKILQSHYDREGMSQDLISLCSTETGSAIIEIDESSAQNRIIVIPGANALVDATMVANAEAEFADSVAVLTQFETTVSAVLECKRLAQKYGKPFILNTAPFIKVDQSIFDGVDYVTPNETEAEFFTGIPVNSAEDCRRAAQRFLELGVKNVIITLGVRGVYFYDGKTELTVPAILKKAVETTGAGDAFNGGFATAIAEGADILTALRFATCTSAISVTRLGSAESMPERKEILALFKEQFGSEYPY